MAEINGLLNRRTTLKLYRGFESLPHRTETVPDSGAVFLLIYLIKARYIINDKIAETIPIPIPAKTSVGKCWARYTREYPTNNARTGRMIEKIFLFNIYASIKAIVKAVDV